MDATDERGKARCLLPLYLSRLVHTGQTARLGIARAHHAVHPQQIALVILRMSRFGAGWRGGRTAVRPVLVSSLAGGGWCRRRVAALRRALREPLEAQGVDTVFREAGIDESVTQHPHRLGLGASDQLGGV